MLIVGFLSHTKTVFGSWHVVCPVDSEIVVKTGLIADYWLLIPQVSIRWVRWPAWRKDESDPHEVFSFLLRERLLVRIIVYKPPTKTFVEWRFQSILHNSASFGISFRWFPTTRTQFPVCETSRAQCDPILLWTHRVLSQRDLELSILVYSTAPFAYAHRSHGTGIFT